MGYYCTVPQCTSLAGKTKNVKFHRFPRDIVLADKWNEILKRNKPYTKYSKVCSLHFKETDYSMTTMGKNKGLWKSLNKDAIPTRNLPECNPDGSLIVKRKTRTSKASAESQQTSIRVKSEPFILAEEKENGNNASAVNSSWLDNSESHSQSSEGNHNDIDASSRKIEKSTQNDSTSTPPNLSSHNIPNGNILLIPEKTYSVPITYSKQPLTTSHIPVPAIIRTPTLNRPSASPIQLQDATPAFIPSTPELSTVSVGIHNSLQKSIVPMAFDCQALVTGSPQIAALPPIADVTEIVNAPRMLHALSHRIEKRMQDANVQTDPEPPSPQISPADVENYEQKNASELPAVSPTSNQTSYSSVVVDSPPDAYSEDLERRFEEQMEMEMSQLSQEQVEQQIGRMDEQIERIVKQQLAVEREIGLQQQNSEQQMQLDPQSVEFGLSHLDEIKCDQPQVDETVLFTDDSSEVEGDSNGGASHLIEVKCDIDNQPQMDETDVLSENSFEIKDEFSAGQSLQNQINFDADSQSPMEEKNFYPDNLSDVKDESSTDSVRQDSAFESVQSQLCYPFFNNHVLGGIDTAAFQSFINEQAQLAEIQSQQTHQVLPALPAFQQSQRFAQTVNLLGPEQLMAKQNALSGLCRDTVAVNTLKKPFFYTDVGQLNNLQNNILMYSKYEDIVRSMNQ